MISAVIIMALCVLLMLAGAIPVAGGAQVVVFRTPVFVLLCTVLALLLVACCWRRRRVWHQLGFLLAHLGTVVILAGAGIGHVWGQRTSLRLFQDPEYVVDRFVMRDGTPVDPGFSVALVSYAVDFYAPDYTRYIVEPPTGEETSVQYTPAGTYRPTAAGTVVVPGVGSSELLRRHHQDGTDDWVRQYVMPDGSMLQMNHPTVRRYRAILRITEDARTREEVLEVNHPLQINDWRLYFMNEDRERHQFIDLQVRKDPGRRLVIGGIWALIAGVCMLCFFTRRRSHADS